MTELSQSPLPVWSEKVTVRSYNTDTQGRCRLTALLDFLQEAAGNHATHLGVGHADLLSNNMAWVLSRLFIDVKKYPSWGEQITLETWPSSYDRIFAYRDFQISDKHGNNLAYGKTAWVVMNIEARKMVPASQLVSHISHFPDKLGVSRLPSKISEKIEGACPCNSEYVVRYSDLDTNEHVNNVKYVQWMLNDYGLEFLKANEVASLSVNYLEETLPYQSLCHTFAKITTDPIQFIHNFSRTSDEKIIFKSEILWRTKNIV